MLLIGSLIGGKSSGDMLKQFLVWTAGNYAATLVLAALGGAVGSRQAAARTAVRDWFSLFTRVAAATVFLLLITGGLVTGLEAGLAVPDWPNSFGHNMLLYPLSQMIGGVYYEHAHRLYGMLVGVTAITIAISAFLLDARPWLRTLAIVFLLMVCTQGVLGGTRVTQTSVPLAIVHGIFGQIVFATACAIAAVTSPTWLSPEPGHAREGAETDRRWTMLLVGALLLQLILGAMYRHMQHVHVLYTHALWAAFVAGFAVFAGGRASSRNPDQRTLVRNGKAVMHTVGLQIALGIVALIAVLSRQSTPPMTSGQATPVGTIPLWEIIFTTAHQAIGALLLGLATMLMLWTRRLVTAQRHEAG
jgi:cytochrome c oxidase assembly protein subunit 15